ncbi:MAG: hypothetical protein FWE57_02380, partial [Chitinispirillia bacterium]|nr:hypothetical protein [Chitinispirillia bacterium]
EKLDYLKMNKNEKAAYDAYWGDRSSVNSAIHTAKINGFADGVNKGREEGAKKLAELIKNGVPLDEAMKMLGL